MVQTVVNGLKVTRCCVFAPRACVSITCYLFSGNIGKKSAEGKLDLPSVRRVLCCNSGVDGKKYTPYTFFINVMATAVACTHGLVRVSLHDKPRILGKTHISEVWHSTHYCQPQVLPGRQ